MITLCGFSLSNYYNKVKMTLLEKGVPFAEERVLTGAPTETHLAASPLGKVPFIRTDEGTLCESMAIVEYIEAKFPNPPLMPADLWQQAKVRELIVFVDLHLELVVRELYPQAFFGGTVSDSTQARVKKQLAKNIAGFKRLARFSPYLAGPEFSHADCAAFVTLPLVAMASKVIYGEDMLAAAGVDWKPYAKLIGERPSAQKVNTDRKADQERSAAALSKSRA
jgi:glutathione S-transferase